MIQTQSSDLFDPSPRIHPCRWDWCRLTFPSIVDLKDHIVNDHTAHLKSVRRKDIPAWRRIEEGIGESLSLSGYGLGHSSQLNVVLTQGTAESDNTDEESNTEESSESQYGMDSDEQVSQMSDIVPPSTPVANRSPPNLEPPSVPATPTFASLTSRAQTPAIFNPEPPSHDALVRGALKSSAYMTLYEEEDPTAANSSPGSHRAVEEMLTQEPEMEEDVPLSSPVLTVDPRLLRGPQELQDEDPFGGASIGSTNAPPSLIIHTPRSQADGLNQRRVKQVAPTTVTTPDRLRAPSFPSPAPQNQGWYNRVPPSMQIRATRTAFTERSVSSSSTPRTEILHVEHREVASEVETPKRPTTGATYVNELLTDMSSPLQSTPTTPTPAPSQFDGSSTLEWSQPATQEYPEILTQAPYQSQLLSQ